MPESVYKGMPMEMLPDDLGGSSIDAVKVDIGVRSQNNMGWIVLYNVFLHYREDLAEDCCFVLVRGNVVRHS